MKVRLKFTWNHNSEKFSNASNCVSCNAPCLGLKHVYNCAVYFYTLVPSTRRGTPNRPIGLKPPLSETHHGPLKMLRSQGKVLSVTPEPGNLKNWVYDHVYIFDMWLVKMLKLIKHRITHVNSDFRSIKSSFFRSSALIMWNIKRDFLLKKRGLSVKTRG